MARSDEGRRRAGAVLHDRGTRVLSTAMVVLGVLFLIQAVTSGRVYAGVLGILFIAAGSGRLYVLARGRREGE